MTIRESVMLCSPGEGGGAGMGLIEGDPIEGERIRLRRLRLTDAAFILELVNEPDFIRNIGDKGVRSHDDARDYLLAGPLTSYERHGFGLYGIELRETAALIGVCGLLKRDWLEVADLGFATLAGFRQRGLTREAAGLMVGSAASEYGLDRLAAITLPENRASIDLLVSLGFRFERMIVPEGGGDQLRLFMRTAA